MPSHRSPHKRKRGPKPLRPTAEQRHHVQLAVSVGLSVDMISAAMETPRRSIYRHFANEIVTGRAKRLLANALRLDAMAEAGNVSAARYLHSLMLDHGQASQAAYDQCEDVAISENGDDEINLAQNPDFGGLNGQTRADHERNGGDH